VSIRRRRLLLLVILATATVVGLNTLRDRDTAAKRSAAEQGPAPASSMQSRAGDRSAERVSEHAILPGVHAGGRAKNVEARTVRRQLRIEQIAPGAYDVSKADLDAILDAAGRGAEWALTVQPAFSFGAGLHYRISSEAGEGLLLEEGLAVVDPKLSRLAGIEPGDVILKVNGYSVTGAYVALLDMRRDPDRSTVQVELDRGGTKVTQLYRLR
jgi:hypothetical protein